MRDLFVAAIVFGTLPFVLRRPFIGILLLAWLGFMNPHRLCWGFMQTTPVVMITTVFTLVGMLAAKEEPKRIVWSPEVVVLVVFILWMGVTTTQAFNGPAAIEQYIKVLKIQILTIMTLVMLTSRQRIHLFVWVIVLSLGFYGVKGGIFTIMKGGVHRVQGPAGSFIEGNNELALALVMTLPLMRYLQQQEPRRLVKLALNGAILLTIVAAIGSQSRGAFVALAVTGSYFWWKSRRKIATTLLIGIAIAIVVNVMPEAWYERMRTIQTYEADGSARGRLDAWQTAWNLGKDRLTGGGFETWTARVFAVYGPGGRYARDVHSIYFEVLGEHGFIGLALFMSLLVLTWLKCRTVSRLVKRRPDMIWARDLATMIQVTLIGYMSAGAFLGLAYFDYFYALVAIVVMLHHVITQQLKSVPAQSSPAGAPSDSTAGGAPALQQS
jgi:probable O-glycosylation ligase (exosortase A-associated)